MVYKPTNISGGAPSCSSMFASEQREDFCSDWFDQRFGPEMAVVRATAYGMCPEEDSHSYGGFLNWGYPQMDGL